MIYDLSLAAEKEEGCGEQDRTESERPETMARARERRLYLRAPRIASGYLRPKRGSPFAPHEIAPSASRGLCRTGSPLGADGGPA